MSTLIIHPEDFSTTFLETVYQNLMDKTLVTGGVSKEQLKKLVEKNERIIMLGHGSPSGLFAVGQFGFYSDLIIDHTFVPLLRKSKSNIFIWCYADAFVNLYNLKGFYSGMFISEVEEANYCGLPFISQEMVDESNYAFGNILSDNLCQDANIIYHNVRTKYGVLAKKNPVALYNWERLNFKN